MKLFIGPAGNASGATAPGAEASFKYIESIGLNLQELAFVQQVYLSPEKATEVGEQARQHGIFLSIHAPYFINLCSEDAAKLASSRKRISDSLDRAERLGCQGPVVVHAGFYQKRDKKECFDAVVTEAIDLSKAYPKAFLGFETTGKHSAFGSFEEALEVCKATKRDNVVPVIDFAHLYARNNGTIGFGGVLDSLIEYGHKSCHFHYSGINYGEKGEKNHLPLSSNQPDYAPLASALKERKNKFERVSLVSESPLQEKDGLVLKALLGRVGFSLA
ncbi:hypothetical protein AUJ14_03635 [Candidatus Micrarchaeota archaeon CG1_02_55_22]|nr:MAG: hypothetical protein AUJ14_03635 [Candidatus Micrarchaeota archaeon CG1_02_55_22]